VSCVPGAAGLVGHARIIIIIWLITKKAKWQWLWKTKEGWLLYQIADKQQYNNDPGIGSPGERVRRPAQHPDLRGVRCAPTVP
jgi:hypothetical protein